MAGQDDAWVRVEFLDRWMADREDGRHLPLDHYLALWPGHEAAVGALWAGISAKTEPDWCHRAGPPPDRVGPYQLLQELGRGGQAVVYLAEDSRLGRRVALKVLPVAGRQGAEELLRRFRREAAVTSRLDHPGIAVVHEAGADGDRAWIAMRHVEGSTLAELIRQSRDSAGDGSPGTVRIPGEDPAGALAASGGAGPGDPSPTVRTPTGRAEVRRAVGIIEEAARALHAAHEAGVIHRDVKPGNIMVTPNGRPVLLDFGLARDESDETLTRTGDLFGTPAYMSPEQIAGRPLDGRTDVYSLGVTLYECLTLDRPFAGATREALYDAIRLREPPDPRRRNPHLSRDLGVVVRTAMEKDPLRRYQSALDFAGDLQAVLEFRPIRARAPSALSQAAFWARREPAKAVVVLLLAIGAPSLAGLGGYLAAKRDVIAAGEAKLFTDRVESVVEDAYFRLLTGDHEHSARLFQEALDLDPGNPEAVAGIPMRTADEALAWLARWDETTTGHRAILRRRVSMLRRPGREEEARALEERLGPPRDSLDLMISGMMALGSSAWAPERARASLLLVQGAIAAAPRARRLYHFHWATSARMAGDAAAAADCARSIGALWPDDALAWFMIGLCRELGDEAAAITAYETALRLDPALWRARMNIGGIRLQNGDPSGAAAEYRRAFEQNPADAAVIEGFGGALLALGDHDQIREMLRRAVDTAPADASVHRQCLETLKEAGDQEDLSAEHERWARIRPQDPAAWQELARALIAAARGGDAEDSRGALDAATRAAVLSQRRDPAILHTLARAHFQSGDPDRAVAAAEEALRLAGDVPAGAGSATTGLREEIERSLVRFREAAESAGGRSR